MPQATGAKISAIEFINILFGRNRTKGLIYFSSLPNDRNDPTERGERRLLTRDPEELERFIAKHDKPKRGLFFCVGTVNGKRNKANVEEIPGVWADLDFKGVNHTLEEIRAALAKLKCLPSLVVQSGHGLHLYWLFGKGIHAQINAVRIENVLRALADHIGGDTQVCEIARLMRLPGTHNTKFDSWVEVVVEISTGAQYHLEELEEWLALDAKPILHRRPVANGNTPAGDGAPPMDAMGRIDNPFLAVAQMQGFKPPIDVDAMLAGMIVGPRGANGNIHKSSLSVSAAMLERGMDPEEVTKTVVDAVMAAAARANVTWSRDVEEREWVRPMVKSWLKEHPQKRSQPDRTVVENVVDIGAERTKRKPKPELGQSKSKKHIMLAKTVLEVMRGRGELLMFVGAGNYRYADNLWQLVLDKPLAAWLDAQLEAGAAALELQSDKRLIGEARAWILRQPDLHQTDIAFDDHGQVPTKSGLVDPRTGKVTPPAPEHYASWRVECDYNPAARCPHWLRMMNDALSDRDDVVRSELISLLQEILGAGLIDARGKALSKALVFWGANDTAKSGLLDVMAGLYGKAKNETSFKALEGSHGLMPFEKRRPWLLHEAFDQGAWFFSSIVKSLISGDEVSINMKNGPFISRRMRAPILWGTNHRPQFKEATRAMAERMIIVRCRRQFKQNEHVGVAAIADNQGYDKPSSLVLDTEMEGLLAWAIGGLQRCLARGFFVIPEEVRAAADDIVRDSNIVAGFIEDGIYFDRNTMISTQDFAGAFNIWWVENRGDDAHIPSSYSIGKYLSSYGDPRIAIDAKELRVSAQRFYAGIGLNTDGKRCWNDMHASEVFRLKERKTGMSALKENPNRPIPTSWKDKPSVKAMRKAFAEYMTDGDTHEAPPDTSDRVTSVSPTQASDRPNKPRF